MRRITIPTGLLATSLGVLAMTTPAAAATTSQTPSEVTELLQQVARDNLRDLQVTELMQQVARDNLRDLRAAERPPRPSARRGHKVVWRGGKWRQVPLAHH